MKLSLHRSGDSPEWATILKPRRNNWQHMAAATSGVATPGNFITATGFFIAATGLIALLEHRYWPGLVLLICGRLLDIADGWAAQKTGTKSPIGEAFDAGADKIITIGSLVVLGITAIVPWWTLIVLMFPHLFISVISLYKFSHGTKLHPTRTGKTSMLLSWITVGMFVLGTALHDNGYHIAYAAGYGLTFAAFGFGMYAASEYMAGRRQSPSDR